MKFQKLLAWVVEFFTALTAYIEAEKATAIERKIEQDVRAENERTAKAGRAADIVRNGGGVPIDKDPLNRANKAPKQR